MAAEPAALRVMADEGARMSKVSVSCIAVSAVLWKELVSVFIYIYIDFCL